MDVGFGIWFSETYKTDWKPRKLGKQRSVIRLPDNQDMKMRGLTGSITELRNVNCRQKVDSWIVRLLL